MKLSCPLQGCHSSAPIGSPNGILFQKERGIRLIGKPLVTLVTGLRTS